MTLRTRLAWWYAGIFSASLLAIGLVAYSELIVEQRAKAAKHHGDWVDEDAGEDLTQIILLYGGSAVVVGMLGGWWLTSRALAPVSRLTRAVEKIQENNLDQKLPRTGNGDELDRLTEVFNAMTGRLSGSFNRIREFTLHASHELKTPLTVMRGEVETALREGPLPAEQRERLLSQLDEIQRLTTIVDGLSLLTKADAGQVRLNVEPVRLEELVRDNFADTQILAEPIGVKVDLETCDAVAIHGDRHRLRQLLLNLADNAVKYNQPQGRVTMNLRSVDGCAEFTIANTGAGIPAEILPRVFDRFFRGDPAHSQTDGCGLGLSIAKWIVNAHHGTIRVESTPSPWTTVTVRLPVQASK